MDMIYNDYNFVPVMTHIARAIDNNTLISSANNV